MSHSSHSKRLLPTEPFLRSGGDVLVPRAGAEILLILGLLWAALAGYAISPRPLWLFGHPLQRAELAEWARRSSADGAPSPASEGAVAQSAATEPQPAKPDTHVEAASRSIDETPQRILILGDSMIDGLLPRLTDYGAENGHSVSAVIWYGSRTIDWAKGTRLREMLTAYQPTFVIVALGSSELKVRDVEKRSAAVARMLELFGARKVVWIGPPNWTTDTGINALLLRMLGEGRFFRSADLHFERKKDGIHPTLAASERWMDAVARFIVEESAVPIRLVAPVTTGRPRPRVRVFPPPS